MKTALVGQAQLIGLHWSKLARSILYFGICLTYHDEMKRNQFQWKWRKNDLLSLGMLIGED